MMKSTKLKAITANNINVAQMVISVCDRVYHVCKSQASVFSILHIVFKISLDPSLAVDDGTSLFFGQCRAGSDCTYVQSDLALHSPKNKSVIANRRRRASVFSILQLLHIAKINLSPSLAVHDHESIFRRV